MGFHYVNSSLVGDGVLDASHPEVLIYEASEGGAGVLRQIAEDPAVLPLLARRALEICHFDPDTLEDRAARTCGRACYECLLDYGNQPDHKDLDRALIRDHLQALARAEGGIVGKGGDAARACLRLIETKRAFWDVPA